MENNQPLVSIIVVTYNSAQYVLETLESAKAQSYQNIELIIADDSSKDNTLQIVDAWIKDNYKRFKKTVIVRSGINTGTPTNCNRGLKASEGEWIKFIAGDDILMPHCVGLVRRRVARCAPDLAAMRQAMGLRP